MVLSTDGYAPGIETPLRATLAEFVSAALFVGAATLVGGTVGLVGGACAAGVRLVAGGPMGFAAGMLVLGGLSGRAPPAGVVAVALTLAGCLVTDRSIARQRRRVVGGFAVAAGAVGGAVGWIRVTGLDIDLWVLSGGVLCVLALCLYGLHRYELVVLGEVAT